MKKGNGNGIVASLPLRVPLHAEAEGVVSRSENGLDEAVFGECAWTQAIGQPRGDFGHHIKTEGFYRHQLFVLGFKRAKNRSQHATANLVQDAICAERRRRGKPGGVVVWQRRNS